jgi:Starch-binding associating with outer membrane
MKQNIFKIALLAVLFSGVVSCKKQIDGAYQNPNADVRVPIEQLLPGIVASMACNAAGHGTMNDTRFVGKYVQNFLFCNSGGFFDQMGYLPNSDNAGSIWRMHYYDIGQNCMKMIQWGTEEKKWDYVGVGQAIFAWSWLTTTDYHGEVILKEAFNTDLITFKFDTQEEVYDYVRKLCYAAIDNLNKTGDGVSAANLALGDQFFYNGDVNKWKKFVYGILARSYNHLSNKSTYLPDSVIYYADRSITTVADNAQVKFGYNGGVSGSANFFGPLRGNLASVGVGTETAIRQSAFIADLESGLNPAFTGATLVDPRAWYILRSNTNNTFKGLTPNKGQTIITANDRPESFWGASQAAGVNNVAPSTDASCRFIFRNTSPFPILTSAEVLFMKSEAALRKGDKATALAAYQAAIGQHFDMLSTDFSANIPAGREITPANKAAYIAAASPATAAALNRTAIMMQKYIALWGYGALETWVDMRRYHYKDIDPETAQQVYRNFTTPSGIDLYVDNQPDKLVYRVRPRFNSEYVWNINELIRIGATALDYHTRECWFSRP